MFVATTPGYPCRWTTFRSWFDLSSSSGFTANGLVIQVECGCKIMENSLVKQIDVDGPYDGGRFLPAECIGMVVFHRNGSGYDRAGSPIAAASGGTK